MAKPTAERLNVAGVSRREFDTLSNRVEDLCDFLYGNNVRPPLTERSADELPARVKLSNEDDTEDD
jgi:hypothetical protein